MQDDTKQDDTKQDDTIQDDARQEPTESTCIRATAKIYLRHLGYSMSPASDPPDVFTEEEFTTSDIVQFSDYLRVNYGPQYDAATTQMALAYPDTLPAAFLDILKFGPPPKEDKDETNESTGVAEPEPAEKDVASANKAPVAVELPVAPPAPVTPPASVASPAPIAAPAPVEPPAPVAPPAVSESTTEESTETAATPAPAPAAKTTTKKKGS